MPSSGSPSSAAEEALPVAWEISDWGTVFFTSGWLAIAYLKLGQQDKAQRLLDRLFSEAPARIYKLEAHGIAYAQILYAQIRLATGRLGDALNTVRRALVAAEEGAFRVEEAAANRVLAQVYEAMDDRAAADAAFRRSLEVLDRSQSPPELAQTLLAYGRFRRGDNAQEDRALLEHALRLFEDMNAPGWIDEARAALAGATTL